jgi:hypothetical protein
MDIGNTSSPICKVRSFGDNHNGETIIHAAKEIPPQKYLAKYRD